MGSWMCECETRLIFGKRVEDFLLTTPPVMQFIIGSFRNTRINLDLNRKEMTYI